MSHRRYNPLRRSWVLCSPNRISRPWQGELEVHNCGEKIHYDPQCYLCPTNRRSCSVNPDYKGPFVFLNDFPALNSTEGKVEGSDLLISERVTGSCFVICFSPSHSETLATLPQQAVASVIETWQQLYNQAVADPEIRYCMVFENRGEAMGCSNPHPHGQCWNTSFVPDEPEIEHKSLVEYYLQNNEHMLEKYAEIEAAGPREVCSNQSFIALVPFWAMWPFEVLILTRKRRKSISSLSKSEVLELAEILGEVTRRYDRLFNVPFPYSMGVHQAYTCETSEDVEHLRISFFPPLLRSASVKKFQVGFEMFGMPQRDITPEQAADRLRNVEIN